MAGIGLLNEKQLHASLKEWYAGPEDLFEVPLDGFVIDIVRDGLLVEIQTGGFASIKSKLLKLSRARRIRLVYPIAMEKWIVKPAGDIGRFTRRRSPKRGRLEDLFWEMVSFPHLLRNPNFSLEVLLIREEELRRYDDTGRRGRRWRTKGWVTEERRLLEVVDRRLFESPADWQRLLPPELRSGFTAKELAEALGIRAQLAQRMAYCLSKAEVSRLAGKRGGPISTRWWGRHIWKWSFLGEAYDALPPRMRLRDRTTVSLQQHLMCVVSHEQGSSSTHIIHGTASSVPPERVAYGNVGKPVVSAICAPGGRHTLYHCGGD